jgi:ubiquinone biosynthesis protein
VASPLTEVELRTSAPEDLRAALASLLPPGTSHEERVHAIEAALASPAGRAMRDAMARWVVDEFVPVPRLVPEAYERWRPPVREAMMFVVARLSSPRLAPKLLEQLELPPKTKPETRLLRLIAKVPGLQKLGQVIARNQHLRPALRLALTRLENGIRDVTPHDVHTIVRRELGSRLDTYEVTLAKTILSEASVSAVIRFTWRNPKSGKRERGVFKVLKPHIPAYFAEDMDYLQGLAEYFSDRHRSYGFPAAIIPDTFRKVRTLLRHEVDFAREQKTLVEAAPMYRSLKSVRVPKVIARLCTKNITALSEEYGTKVTTAATRLSSADRRRLAEQIVEALVAVPLFAPEEHAIFHGDPHAGNLLFDGRSGVLTIIDWALRERLTREQRRHLALLVIMAGLRDPEATWREVLALSQPRLARDSRRGRQVRELVTGFLDELPALQLPSAVDAMRLLEHVAVQGTRFPRSLIMLSKVMFTLEGMLSDIAPGGQSMGLPLMRRVAQHWLLHRQNFRSPLGAWDWVALQRSGILYPSRVWLQWERALLDRVLPAKTASP